MSFLFKNGSQFLFKSACKIDWRVKENASKQTHFSFHWSSYSWALGEKEKLEILLVLVGFLMTHMKTQLFQPLVKYLDKLQLLSSGGDFAHSKII